MTPPNPIKYQKGKPAQRPKNLNLLTIRLPVPALVSILHRVSGFLLFLVIPLLLYVLQTVLLSEAGFEQMKVLLDGWIFKLIVFPVLWAFWHHFCAGLRHLAMDFHWGMALKQARLTSKLVLALSLLLTLASMWFIC